MRGREDRAIGKWLPEFLHSHASVFLRGFGLAWFYLPT
jgi:hypothetical protein